MFYSDNIQETREVFFSCWHKHCHKMPLLPLEQQVVEVILVHPEYHAMLENASASKDQTYLPEMGQTNPFLHLGLHLAIRDQISTNRPLGITPIYQQLLQKLTDKLAVEHLMMEHLVECLWQTQRNQCPPDEKEYLDSLARLL